MAKLKAPGEIVISRTGQEPFTLRPGDRAVFVSSRSMWDSSDKPRRRRVETATAFVCIAGEWKLAFGDTLTRNSPAVGPDGYNRRSFSPEWVEPFDVEREAQLAAEASEYDATEAALSVIRATHDNRWRKVLRVNPDLRAKLKEALEKDLA